MTPAHLHSPPRAQSARLATSADAAGAAVRAHGLRLSAARRLVLEAIYTAEGPVKAEEIAGGLDGRLPRSDLASVYRNLETLERLGLVRHVHLGHGPGRYERVGPHRDYLVCEQCHTIASLPRDQLEAARRTITEVTGFAVRFDHFPLTGLCPGCSDSAADYARR